MSDLFDQNQAEANKSITQFTIYDEMKKSYLDYAMSVIISRALPDVRDGLKPVHRRIVYTMYESGYVYNKPFRKSARVVGDVMGKYHPHGDSAIYDALVRMAQSFSLRLPLINGQGNFGSMDGDSAAAMRYTEARMAKSAHALIDDIDKETVDFKPNYDDSLQEPSVLPARYPNILVNGASGIAVGMATNIPTHNLGELCDALFALIDNNEITIDELIEYVKGPDFPTGARILGRTGIVNAFYTGRGSISICGVARVDTNAKRNHIIISEIPWQVNKSKLVQEISEIKHRSQTKELDVISSVRDESDRHGVRVVVELKRDANPDIVLNYLQKYTSFQVYFGINMLAIDNGVPKLMNLKSILVAFLNFRKEVIKRRTLYLLNKARDKSHILAGLGVAVENIDEIISLIKAAANPQVAKENLLAKAWQVGSIAPFIALLDEPERPVIDGHYKLSESQAKAILDLRLHRLTGLEREKIQSDLDNLAIEIKNYLDILSSNTRLMTIITEELQEIKDKFATPRKTQIEDSVEDFDEEDFILNEEVAITVTNSGYIKRMPIDSYRTQKRGGKGKIGINTKQSDIVTDIIITNTHANLLFFTSKGLVYRIKCYKIPEASLHSVGRALVNLIPIAKHETITTILPIIDIPDDKDIIFVTKFGNIRRNKLSDFKNIATKGKIAMKLVENDDLVGVLLADGLQDVLLSSKLGKSIRFPVESLRVFSSRNSSGVRALNLTNEDVVINVSLLIHEKVEDIDIRDKYLKFSTAKRRHEKVAPEDKLPEDIIASLIAKEEYILTVTSKGYGKRTSAYEYRITNRGGKGFLGGKLSKKSGDIVASFIVENDDEIIIISSKGQVIRLNIKDIRFTSRVSLGVKLFNLDSKEFIVSVSKIKKIIADEELEESSKNQVNSLKTVKKDSKSLDNSNSSSILDIKTDNE